MDSSALETFVSGGLDISECYLATLNAGLSIGLDQPSSPISPTSTQSSSPTDVVFPWPYTNPAKPVGSDQESNLNSSPSVQRRRDNRRARNSALIGSIGISISDP
jgi:hypothetical protein